MFWEAIIRGLGVLIHWETYIAVVLYFVIFVGPLVLVGLAVQRSEVGTGLGGCLMTFVMPVLQTFAIFVFVLTLFPIILGVGNGAAWTLPWVLGGQDPWLMARMVVVLFIAALLMAFVPLVGAWESLHTAVLGSIALTFVIRMLDSPGSVYSHIALWPGLWFFLGLVAVGGLMAWVGRLVAVGLGVLVSAGLARVLKNSTEGIATLLMFPMAGIFGFLPMFLYGAYLAAQIHSSG
ncbi:MAG TPA: hypothetical protein VEJ00_03235 [Candidatus Acidoferrales bacterium]|nr:hypothetical protein [Candidatus Acidoferrales bacterium]